MKNLQIVLNPNDPSYADIEKELQAQLAALETVKFEVRTEPSPAGTLAVPGLEQVTAFVIAHPAQVIPLATALINLLNTILSRFPGSGSEGKKKSPFRAAIVADEQQLAFPSSENLQDKFLKGVESAEKKGF